jgi:hypothetical protein
MTDSPNRRYLSRRVVVASYAISVGGFLIICMIGTGITVGEPLMGLVLPVCGFPLVVRDMMGYPGTKLGALQTLLLLLCLCPMLLPLLGLSGFVISLRRPDRSGWFVCGHVCLGVYYLLCALLIMLFALLSALGSGPS